MSTRSMNSIRTLELPEDRLHQTNVFAQSRVLSELLQREIDTNRKMRCFVIDNIVVYDENITMLRSRGFDVVSKGDDSILIKW